MFNNVFSFIQPKEINVDGKNLVISKFPAVSGMEIATQFPMSFKGLDAAFISQLALKVMNYVAVEIENSKYIRLNSIDQINSHLLTDYPLETLGKIIIEIAEYNFSFLQPGSLLGFLTDSLQMLQESILKISTASSELLSPMEKQH